ncbi:uncharacterized protein PAC_17267 [Phialocephala subalpina]|uniref:Uncharacterized protein n=1 Tax=Phialocephala subalpina TaxID=576137 RepID=A0A1L7XQY9_9HELO|nr:uncharacterized protein PAC_17267 [Phialocephala subalpina]
MQVLGPMPMWLTEMLATSEYRHALDPSTSDSESDSEYLAEAGGQDNDPFGYKNIGGDCGDVNDDSSSASGKGTISKGVVNGKPKRLKNPIPAQEIIPRLRPLLYKIRTQNNINGHTGTLKTILDSWHDQRHDCEAPFPAVAHMLEESYDVDNKQFSVTDLRGTDAVLVSRLEKACKDSGFYLCLASMRVIVKKWYGDPSGAMCPQEARELRGNTSLVVRNFLDVVEGHSIFRALKRNLHVENLLEGEYCCEGARPASQYDDRKTSAWRVTNVKTFNRKVAIIMPREWKVPFHLGNQGSKLDSSIDRVFSKFNVLERHEQQNPMLQDDVCQICERLLEKVTWEDALGAVQPYLRTQVVNAVAKSGSKDLIKRALPWAFASDSHRGALDAVAERYGKGWLISSLEWHSVKVASFEGNLILVTRISEYVANGAWASNQYASLFASFEFGTASEGKMLARLARSWVAHPEAYPKWLSPALKRRAGEGFMILSFLAHIQGISELNFMFKDLISLSYDHIIEPKYSVEDADTWIESSEEYYDIICRILIGCYNLKLAKELDQLVGAFLKDAATAPPRRLNIYPPLLSKLASLMKVDELLGCPMFQNLYRGILETLVTLIPDEPKPATTWSRPARGCDICIQCEALDAFLIDESQMYMEFDSKHEGFNMKALRHLETRLQSEAKSGAIKSTVFGYEHQERLELTKVDVQYERERGTWKKHRDRAEALIHGVHVQIWKIVLGNRFSDFMALRSMRITPARPQQPDSDLAASSSTNATIQTTIAHVAPEIIDFTSPQPENRETQPVTLLADGVGPNIDTQPQHKSSLNPAPPEVASETQPALGPVGNGAINIILLNQQKKRRRSGSEITLEPGKGSENLSTAKLPRTSSSSFAEQAPNLVFARTSELQKHQEPDVSTISADFYSKEQNTPQSAPDRTPIEGYQNLQELLDSSRTATVGVSSPTPPQTAHVPAPDDVLQPISNASKVHNFQPPDQSAPQPAVINVSAPAQPYHVPTYQMAGASNIPGAFQTSLRPAQQPPFTPRWLEDCLMSLQSQYPLDRFEGCMDHIYDIANGVFYYVPAIICIECDRRKFFPGEGATVEWFRTHIIEADHRARVHRNLAASAALTEPQFNYP